MKVVNAIASLATAMLVYLAGSRSYENLRSAVLPPALAMGDACHLKEYHLAPVWVPDETFGIRGVPAFLVPSVERFWDVHGDEYCPPPPPPPTKAATTVGGAGVVDAVLRGAFLRFAAWIDPESVPQPPQQQPEQAPEAKSIGDAFEAFVEWFYSEELPRLVREVVPNGGSGYYYYAYEATSFFVESAQARVQDLYSMLRNAVSDAAATDAMTKQGSEALLSSVRNLSNMLRATELKLEAAEAKLRFAPMNHFRDVRVYQLIAMYVVLVIFFGLFMKMEFDSENHLLANINILQKNLAQEVLKFNNVSAAAQHFMDVNQKLKDANALEGRMLRWLLSNIEDPLAGLTVFENSPDLAALEKTIKKVTENCWFAAIFVRGKVPELIDAAKTLGIVADEQ